uniref:Uncharacterized protein n=1 Tax=Glossina brevipalpis TaxID=37001 RepID=A0A1A9WUP1_9MUSC
MTLILVLILINLLNLLAYAYYGLTVIWSLGRHSSHKYGAILHNCDNSNYNNNYMETVQTLERTLDIKKQRQISCTNIYIVSVTLRNWYGSEQKQSVCQPTVIAAM